MTDRSGLSGFSAAGDRCGNINFAGEACHCERLKDVASERFRIEIFFKFLAVDGDFAVAEWVELEKKESADRFIEDANHTVVELVLCSFKYLLRI